MYKKPKTRKRGESLQKFTAGKTYKCICCKLPIFRGQPLFRGKQNRQTVCVLCVAAWRSEGGALRQISRYNAETPIEIKTSKPD